MALRNFFAELKRRNVYQVAVAYAVVAWLLIQVATQVFPFFEIQNWIVRLVVLGFPIVLIIAWAFELTPQGIQRTETADNQAIALLQKLFAIPYLGPMNGEQMPLTSALLKLDPMFDPLWNDPRFQKLANSAP
jgi:hypothetical protein